jgi:hypothetical protein
MKKKKRKKPRQAKSGKNVKNTDFFFHEGYNFCGLVEKKRKRARRKTEPLADTQDTMRENISERLYVDQVRSRSEEEKKETRTITPFVKQSGNKDKKKRKKNKNIKDYDRNYATHVNIFKYYPMMNKAIDSI